MSRDWKPGDVARIELGNGVVHPIALRLPLHEGGWATATAKYVHTVHVTEARPLVVIDPEDREAVERYVDITAPHYKRGTRAFANKVDATQNALREFATPTPPRPDEPTGHYAVVEDEAGQEWCRIDPCNGYVWQLLGQPSGQCRYAEWKHIAAVRVLSEGVAR